ncbi:hypothetical protein E2C01_092314 [Portunus trituberculatus]|uniref:Uncharacterized protein n=1 Tax=Portunus trituberculatus TaxID=210409 RepID=A0A5B7JRP5_PORTR|nr:hypothetical protein [Portunus trituberculatus]
MAMTSISLTTPLTKSMGSQ